MYTIEDIRDIAVQIEYNGEKTYRMAGEKAEEKELARILFWLADDEQRHAKWFEALKTKKRDISSGHREMEAMGRALLQEMVKDQPFCLDAGELLEASQVTDIITQSLRFEEDTILFYDMLKTFVDDETAASQLEHIIDEERRHVRVLEKLLEKFVKGVNVDLSWPILL